MARYINRQELIHRICNGFITHDGYVDGEFYDIFVKNDIDIWDPKVSKIIDCIAAIIESMDDYSVNLYPIVYRGAKVRDIRISKGVKISDLSRRTGICKTAIYRIESGKTKPRPETMQKIALVLGVDISDFT